MKKELNKQIEDNMGDVNDENKTKTKIKRRPYVKKYLWEVDLKTDDGTYLTTVTYRTLKEVVAAYPMFSKDQVYDYAMKRGVLQLPKVQERYKNFEFRRVKQENYVAYHRKYRKPKSNAS